MKHEFVGAVLTVLVTSALASCSDSQGPGGTETGFFQSGGIELSYALDLPDGEGPFPAIVIGHGSGRITKANASGNATRLVRAGFAVLRYDKRGVGESGGVYSSWGAFNSDSMVPILGGDMVAGVNFLKTRPEVDPERIGLFGVSQAGWIIAWTVQMSADVKFAVVNSGGAIAVLVQNRYQQLMEDESRSVEQAEAQLKLDDITGYDPDSSLRAVTIPQLYLLGGQDRSAPPRTTEAVLQRLIDLGKPITVEFYLDGEHGLDGIDYWPDVETWLDTVR